MKPAPVENTPDRLPQPPYRGRFAPSPTGPLHAGSMATAFASWLDARAHNGKWLLRIEDLDPPRECVGSSDAIVKLLERCGMYSDEPVVYQRQRSQNYWAALKMLAVNGHVYACRCSRQQVDLQAERSAKPKGVYSGHCRPNKAAQASSLDIDAFDLHAAGACHGEQGSGPARKSVAWRLIVSPNTVVRFDDRAAGPQCQHVDEVVGDFVLRRADGWWAYQLAVVVDDAAQGITDVVRGADLLDNTARQIVLQRRLGFLTPHYMHVDLVLDARGKKLSKQNGAAAIDLMRPIEALKAAALHLGLTVTRERTIHDIQAAALDLWASSVGSRNLRPTMIR